MKYPGIESSTLEFKAEPPLKNQIIKTIIGFCNLYGGRLVLGVTNNGTVTGVDENAIQELTDSLYRSIYDSCSPLIIPQVYSQKIGNKHVVIVEVSSGMNKPYFVSADGMSGGAYIRLGSSTLRASAEIIEELQWQSRGQTFDETPVYQASRAELDLEKVTAFFNQRQQGRKTQITEELLASYKIIVKEHAKEYPSVGAFLLFAKKPQKFLSESFVICTQFARPGERKALATLDCRGTLFDQFDQAYNFITDRLYRSFEITKPKRKVDCEIPEQAIREALINALVHRNYHINAPIKVSLYDNRLEIFSPGVFPGPLDVNHLESGITYIRNTVLAKIFREAGYIEKLGSGFITIFDSYRKKGLVTPQVSEGLNFIKCILPREKRAVESDDFAPRLKKIFLSVEDVSIKDIISELGLSRATAGRRIKEMVDQGLLKIIGRGRGARYQLVV